jgi:hypothetical protein
MLKRLIVLLLLSGAVYSVNAQTVPDNKPVVKVAELKEHSYDFGKIPQGRPVTHVFELVNKSNSPIVIENVLASCGCTTPEWPREPIQPGATASIKVGFNAAAEGAFNRNVTVQIAGGQVETIVITGTVYRTPATSAPLNASLSLLKNSK